MDTTALRKKWEIIKKNQEILHFEIKTSVDEKGIVHLSTTVDEKYKKALQTRLEDLVLNALKLGVQLYNLKDVKEDDKKEFLAMWEDTFDRDKDVLVAILLKEGIDNYLAAVMNSAEKLNLSYFLKNVYPSRTSDGKIQWNGPNKTFLDNGIWKKTDDPTYQRNDPFDWKILCA